MSLTSHKQFPSFSPDKCFEQIIAICKELNKTDNCIYEQVYKICNDISNINSREWFVIMQKLGTTQTNEGRTDVFDKNCAKFRASELLVVKIINIYNPSVTVESITNRYEGFTTIYKVDEIVRPNFYDEDINKIYTGGIHYYKTPTPALYFREIPRQYTGSWIYFYNDGKKSWKGEYVNGISHGNWIYWGPEDQRREGKYVNGEISGLWTIWKNNSVYSYKYYINGGQMDTLNLCSNFVSMIFLIIIFSLIIKTGILSALNLSMSIMFILCCIFYMDLPIL
jgi:antitoxin component YwqK of YwqJK toxin-antitoxin module